jgi:CHAD domain-containing protein
MIRRSKWMKRVALDDSVSVAAHVALKARLQIVWHYLPLAATTKTAAPETVHQLRVSTRRAKATLENYEHVVPRRLARKIGKHLKRIRRAASDARDYDVMIQRLTARCDQPTDPSWAALLDKIHACREASQAPIAEVYERVKRHDLKQRSVQLLTKVRWRGEGPEPTYVEAARDGIRAAEAAFFLAGQEDLNQLEALHAFRICGKHLRYGMELFAPAFIPQFRSELYADVEKVQEKLGSIVDHATAVQRFEHWRSEWSDSVLDGPLSDLIAGEQSALESSRRDFFEWWTPERAAAFRRRFDEVVIAPIADQVA